MVFQSLSFNDLTMARTREQQEKLKPFDLILFGGSGDLAFRKIYPALYHRFIIGESNTDFSVFVIQRQEKEAESFFTELKASLTKLVQGVTEEGLQLFFEKFKLVRITSHSIEGYKELVTALKKSKDRQRIFYYSTPSHVFEEISTALSSAKLVEADSKVVVEKPLGHDLKSSEQINQTILKAFKEEQIYRIDHYLGKETVQNLMVLRFANHLFERAWNSENIESVQITVAESLGVESRAGYYDKSGALRDMVQNHLLQLLCLVAMEPPLSLDSNIVRDEKLKVLQALRKFTPETVKTHTVKGQYTRGRVDGKEVNSYLEDLGAYDSETETYVALETYVDNWRWRAVPFYLRTGKRMKERYSDIVINFKNVKHNIFDENGDVPGNKLIIRLQPEERIELVQMTKIPGPGGYRYKPVALKLDFLDSFQERLPDAYERLIVDVIRGNQTLFMRHDELYAAWEWTESVFHNWEKNKIQNRLYSAGTWGPGDELMTGSNVWHEPHEYEVENV